MLFASKKSKFCCNIASYNPATKPHLGIGGAGGSYGDGGVIGPGGPEMQNATMSRERKVNPAKTNAVCKEIVFFFVQDHSLCQNQYSL